MEPKKTDSQKYEKRIKELGARYRRDKALREKYGISTPAPIEQGVERRHEMERVCQECGGELEATLLGRGIICLSCGFIYFQTTHLLDRLISRDTDADDNLEFGIIMALRAKDRRKVVRDEFGLVHILGVE